MEQIKNPKCNSCKSYWKPDETDILPSGLYAKSCKKCRAYQKEMRERLKCEHNKEKRKCRECGGSSICPHNKRKTLCRECGGGSICEHNREKSKCRECGGGSICEHNKEKSKCRECGGGSICEHNKEKSKCRECGGGSICEHNKRKNACKECNSKLYLVNLLRGHLYRCIKSSNLEKTKPSIDYLGCSVEYFIEYFKKKKDIFNQFSEIEMTFDNIHIDHIKPVSVFNLNDVEEFLSCCNYSNLQPLLAEVNLSKNCKWSDEDDVFWNEKIKDKEYYDIYLPK